MLRSSRSERVALLLTHFLYVVIQNMLNEKKRLYFAFIDLKEAFYSIYWHQLGYKLFKQEFVNENVWKTLT